MINPAAIPVVVGGIFLVGITTLIVVTKARATIRNEWRGAKLTNPAKAQGFSRELLHYLVDSISAASGQGRHRKR